MRNNSEACLTKPRLSEWSNFLPGSSAFTLHAKDCARLEAMSTHSFFRPYGMIGRSTPPTTPSESLAPPSSTTSSVSTPTKTLDDEAPTPSIADERRLPKSSQCVFPIKWDSIRYDGKPLPSIRYRQPHKRTLNSKLQPSAIYKHGAQLTTDGDNKYWLCKYCHVRGYHHTALFSSESTTSIIYHLKHQHKLEEFGYQTAVSNPFNLAKGTTNLTSYLGGRRSVFNDLQFKDNFTDWVIDLDLTFRQATHQRTHEIFAKLYGRCRQDSAKEPVHTW